MKRIHLDEIERKYGLRDYSALCAWIWEANEKEHIKPVKASGTNGKKPALYKEYWILEKKRDYQAEREELLYQLEPCIHTDYYLKHLEQYVADREWVLLLNEYLKSHQKELDNPMAINERSFAIWQREKFLKQEQGRKILKRCEIPEETLNFYETTEPLAYYSSSKSTPQNILIIENKDTFYSMRKYLMEGHDSMMGERMGTLIYGAGKSILRSFQDFSLCMEPYMQNRENQLLYFGDLDYEGIGIYEHLAALFEAEMEIIPFKPAYLKMLSKGARLPKLPDTKEGQNQNISDRFFSYFNEQEQVQMKNMLRAGIYIPQEILNCEDFKGRVNHAI